MATRVGVRGNTITLTITFKDSEDSAVDPDGDVSYTVKDQDAAELDTGTILLADKISTGTFELNYEIPDEEWLSFEFSADVDGTPEVGRIQVHVREYTT
jgi:hypothetical protein